MFFVFDKPVFTDKEITISLRRTYGRESHYGIKKTYCFDIFQAHSHIHVGQCDIRIGESEYLYYMGHIGYRIYPPFRGHHYAQKATALLFNMAKREKMEHVIITCSPDNIASYKTIAGLGGRLLETTTVPKWHELYLRGETEKCIFEFLPGDRKEY